MKLTQKTIGTLTLPEGKFEVIHFDDDLPGFGLRIRAGGSRNFIFQFKIGRQHRRMRLGSATALTRARARKMASELLARVALGNDPSTEKGEAKLRAVERPRSR